MKILQIAPVYESIPPEKYGGAEEMIYYLIQGLIKRGHEVSLIASHDSKTPANLIPIFSHGYNHLLEKKSLEIPQFSQFGISFQDYTAYKLRDRFDIIHNHFYGSNSYGKLMWSKMFRDEIPTVISLHNEVKQGQIGTTIYQEFLDLNYVFLSKAQRKRHKKLKSAGIVYNAVDIKDFPFSNTAENFYFWISKITPVKGVAEAIEAAISADVRLVVSGEPDIPRFEDYWEKVKKYFSHKNITFVGESGMEQKVKYYSRAKALIFPSRHLEGCPMVILESLACGTPVIALDNDVVFEMLKEGHNGFICKSITEMAQAIKKLESLSQKEYLTMRENCRKTIESKFNIENMVKGYERVYQQLIK